MPVCLRVYTVCGNVYRLSGVSMNGLVWCICVEQVWAGRSEEGASDCWAACFKFEHKGGKSERATLLVTFYIQQVCCFQIYLKGFLGIVWNLVRIRRETKQSSETGAGVDFVVFSLNSVFDFHRNSSNNSFMLKLLLKSLDLAKSYSYKICLMLAKFQHFCDSLSGLGWNFYLHI